MVFVQLQQYLNNIPQSPEVSLSFLGGDILTCVVHDTQGIQPPVPAYVGLDAREGLLDRIEVRGIWGEKNEFAD